MRCVRIGLFTGLAILSIFAIGYWALAMPPSVTVPAPAMDPDHPLPGIVSGRVTTDNPSNGWSHVYVAIVNANDLTQAYYVGETDANGNFTFAGVNNTWGTGPIYKLYANTTSGEGITSAFIVNENSTMPVNVIITIAPASTPTTTPTSTPVPTATTTPVPTPTPANTSVPATNATPTAAVTPTPIPGQNSTNVTIVPATVTPAPTPAPTAAPGFEAVLAMAGLAGIGVLRRRMKGHN